MTRSRGQAPHWELISRGSCRVVAHGVARTDLGPWSHRYPAVWAVKFSGAHRPGTYRLALTTRPAAASPWFRIEPAVPAVCRSPGERAVLLPERAGRTRLHPQRAADRGRSPQRRPRDDIPRAEGKPERQLQGLAAAVCDRAADQRDRRLVRRRRLPEIHRDDQLHGRDDAPGNRLVPSQAGRHRRQRPRQLHRRGQVRPGLLAANVGRADQDAVPAGRDRRGEQPLPRGPRHLAAAAGRRSLPRHRPALPVHPAPASLPRRSARRADQPESGRPARGRLRALLPRLPRRATHATRAGACARPRPSTRWPGPTGRASCRPSCPGTSTRRLPGATT